ncbi:MAG: hypothetical protein J6T24_01995 [Clostridia bacterium]|nr:hypothetical protein [Clostridia bacterium]
MLYRIPLFIAAVTFLASLLVAWSTAPLFRRTKKGLSPTNLLIVGTLLSLAVFFFPISFIAHESPTDPLGVITAAVGAFIKAMSTFFGEGDYFGTMETLAELLPTELFGYYRLLAILLHLFAPLLTFGFLLSFVKNFSAMARYRLSFFRAAHIFSELNPHSLALAKSLADAEKKRPFFLRSVIVFTNIRDVDGDAGYELVPQAERLGAILLRRDLESIHFRLLPFGGRRLSFYLLADKQAERLRGEGEKLRYATHIMKTYDDRAVTLYLFSGSRESELYLSARSYQKRRRFTLTPKRDEKREEAALLARAEERALAARGRPENRDRPLGALIDEALASLRKERARARRGERVRLFGCLRTWEELCSLAPEHQRVLRLDDVRSLIYHNLDRYGLRLFRRAKEQNGGEIHALIVGLGQYGTEMLRALSWYAQMPGFSLRITAFDEDSEAADRLSLSMPELMSRAASLSKRGEDEVGDANCRLEVLGGINAEGTAFLERLRALPRVTHVFVALGSDKRNITVASALRTFFCSLDGGYRPDIETVVYDSDYAAMMGVIPEDGSEPPYTVGANVRRQPYNIHMLGDVDTFYSVDTLLNSEMLTAGLYTHIRYGLQYDRIAAKARLAATQALPAEERARFAAEEERLLGRILSLTDELDAFYAVCYPEAYERYSSRKRNMSASERRALLAALRRRYEDGFFANEYNHRSSLAKALAERLRAALVSEGLLSVPTVERGGEQIPELWLPWDERSEEALRAIGAIEHIRWNAYMRSEGYVYGEATNHLTKRHRDLRNVSAISDDDLRKDA